VISEIIIQPERQTDEYYPAPQKGAAGKLGVFTDHPTAGRYFPGFEIQCVWTLIEIYRQDAFQDRCTLYCRG